MRNRTDGKIRAPNMVPPTAGQRGSILVLALLVSASAAVLGMWMVVTGDLKVRKTRYLVRRADAHRIGDSGVELARGMLGNNPAWAGASVTNPKYTNQTLVVSVSDVAYRVARVESLGSISDTTAAVTADVRAVPVKALWYNVFSDLPLTLDNATVGGYLRTNGEVLAVGTIDFSGTVEVIEGKAVAPEINPSQVFETADVVPVPAVNIATYTSAATPLSAVPEVDGDLVLEKVYLSPSSNPYGGLNPDGIYVLDAGARDVVIRDVYIEGTLVVVDVGNVLVEQGYYHTRARSHLATLIVEGDLDLRLESAIGEVDLGADLDGSGLVELAAEYGPAIDGGIVYVTGRFVGARGGFIRGCVIADEVVLVGRVELYEDPDLDELPVMEFTESGSWEIVPGSIIEGT